MPASSASRPRRSPPAPAGLRPLQQVVDGAEVVRDPVLAPVADEEDVHLAQLPPALRAGARGGGARRLIELAGLPVRAPNRPRDDMLQPTEDGSPLTGRLVQAKAVVILDACPAPGTALSAHAPK
jgi:hypothetical protein